MRTATTLVAMLATVALMVGACGGGEGGGPVPQVKEVTAERVAGSGGKQTSRITVRFDRDLELATARVPLASRFELEVPDLVTQSTRRVLIATAEVSKDDRRVIILTVGALVPDGAKVHIDKRAFNVDAEGELVATVQSELSAAFALLATKAFESFLPSFLEAPQVVAPTEADRNQMAMRQALDDHLQARGTNNELRTKALNRFDAMPVDVMPSPKMRAALAALTGTFADAAIDYLLTDKNCTGKPAALIVFQEPPEAPDLLGRSTFTTDRRRVISLNPSTEGDRIEHLMPLLVHEAIHCDRDDGRFEEIAATALDSFLYMQLLAVDPTLVQANTPLARDLNIDVVAMINSGRAVPESVGVLKSPSVTQAVPGSTARAASFGDLVVAAYEGLEQNESRDEGLANTFVAVLAEASGMPALSAFDLAYLDEVLGRAMPPAVLGAALAALEMEPVS